MSRTIYLPKWTLLVATLYNSQPHERYCEKLHRRTGITTRHLRSLIGDLENMGILEEQEDTGKIKYLRLTDTGNELAESILRIYPALNNRR